MVSLCIGLVVWLVLFLDLIIMWIQYLVFHITRDAIKRWLNKPKDVKEEKSIVMVFLIIFKSDYYKKFCSFNPSSLLTI